MFLQKKNSFFEKCQKPWFFTVTKPRDHAKSIGRWILLLARGLKPHIDLLQSPTMKFHSFQNSWNQFRVACDPHPHITSFQTHSWYHRLILEIGLVLAQRLMFSTCHADIASRFSLSQGPQASSFWMFAKLVLHKVLASIENMGLASLKKKPAQQRVWQMGGPAIGTNSKQIYRIKSPWNHECI